MMNRNEFAPNDNGTGELNESEIIGSFFLKADEQLAKTVEERMCDLNNPAACMEIRIAFQFLFFLAARPDMGRITALLNLLLATCIACVQTKILRMILIGLGT